MFIPCHDVEYYALVFETLPEAFKLQMVSICLTLNPLELYVSIICLSDVIMVDFSFFIISAVPNCIIHDIVVINSIILLTYMKSIASVTFLNHSSSALGRSYVAFISIFKSVSLLFFLLMIPSLVQVFLLLAVCLLCWWGSWEAYCLLHIKYNL